MSGTNDDGVAVSGTNDDRVAVCQVLMMTG